MKTSKYIVAGIMALTLPFSYAQAATPYIGGSVGLGFLSDSTIEDDGSKLGELSWDSGFLVGGAIGIKEDVYRLEAEVGYQQNDAKTLTLSGGSESAAKGDVSILSFLANAYYDFNSGTGTLVPFLTAGAGVASIELTEDLDDTVFAWQVGAGLGVELTPDITMDLKYRYFAASDPTYDDTTKLSVSSHDLLLGLRVGF
jgi:opacity protein-like surface antigen